MSNITFVIFVYNEEKRIGLLTRNLIKYGQVLFMDDGSTDQSKEIAESLGARFLRRPAGPTFTETQERLDFVNQHVTTSWIFWSYVDNFLPKSLLEKLTEISQQDKIKYVYVPIFTYLWGDTKNVYVKAAYGSFWKKGMVDFTNNRIHSMGRFLGKEEEKLKLPMRSEYAMRHFSLYDMEKFLTGHWRYAKTEAELKFADGKRLTPVYLFGSMGHYLWIFWGGIKSGMRGILIALLYAFFRLMVCVKLYELEYGWNVETIEAEFVKEKQKIVESIEGKIV